MTLPTELDFTAEDFQRVIPVKIPTHDNKSVDYELRILTGGDATTYDNARTNSIMFDSEGKTTGLSNIAELGPLLVSLCLHTSDGTKVNVTQVKEFPAPIVDKLFEAAKALNGIDTEVEDQEEQVKN